MVAGRVEHLLDAVHVAGEARHDDPSRCRPEHRFDRGGQLALRDREARDLRVRRVDEEQVDALLAEAGEGAQVGHPTVEGELVHLEVAGVHDEAGGGADGDGEPVGDGVVDRNELAAVSQGARDCSYSINPSSASFTTTGGTGAVTVAAPVGCTWTATTNAAWITVTTGANGNGSGSVAYSVGANAGAARTGVLLIGAQSFTINQSSAPCSFGIGPTGQNVTRASGTGTPVTVTTQSFCSWTAVSNDPWITVSTANGVGNGNVSWTYSSNPVPNQRTGTMVIAGRTFTVIQEAGCSYVINPTGQNVSRSAGTGTTVGITTQASCGWTATSNASWITVQSPTSGVGNGSVGWTYAENTVAATRTGTMTIADQTFTVTQDPGCSVRDQPDEPERS